jgi:hypothetical protein
MKLIRPITLTGAMLISSTVAEPDTAPDAATDPAAWNSGTTYSAGQQVYLSSTHRIYESLQGSNLNKAPATETAWWSDVGGTNRWAMFDTFVSTATVEAVPPLTVVFDPGVFNALVLIGCVGTTATVTITDGAGGPTVYSTSLDLQAATVGDWYDYYNEPFRQVPVFVLTDIPGPYVNARVTVEIDGDTTAECGMCIPGLLYSVGDTQYGVRVGIRDYSRKTVDETTGAVTLVQGRFAKTLRAQVRIDSQYFAQVHEKLEQLRATPVVWVADKTGDITPLTVYGFYRDFSLVVDYPSGGIYELEIEGMV